MKSKSFALSTFVLLKRFYIPRYGTLPLFQLEKIKRGERKKKKLIFDKRQSGTKRCTRSSWRYETLEWNASSPIGSWQKINSTDCSRIRRRSVAYPGYFSLCFYYLFTPRASWPIPSGITDGSTEICPRLANFDNHVSWKSS